MVRIAALLATLPGSVSGQQPSWLAEHHVIPRIYGRLTDEETGRPFAGVVLHQLGRVGSVRSDADGYYVMHHIDLGPMTIAFFCPSGRRPFGARQFAVREFTVDSQTDSLLNISLPAKGCVEPPIERNLRELSGHLTWGWENISFAPSEAVEDLTGTAYDGIRAYAWVGYDRLFQLVDPDSLPIVPSSGFQEHRWYVEWRGWLVGPGSYGHMGGALYDFFPTDLLAIRAPSVDDCP